MATALSTEYKQEYRWLAEQTTMRRGRIRVVEVEKIDSSTGRSVRFRGAALRCSREAWGVVKMVSLRPNLYAPMVTDGGLRFVIDTHGCKWFVYSY